MSAAYAEVKFVDGESGSESNVESPAPNAGAASGRCNQFDHSKIVAALINEQGRAVEEREIATPRRTTRAAAVEVAKMIVALAVSQSRARNPINAIGFSVAGRRPGDRPRFDPRVEGLKGWTRVALRQMIEEELKGAGIDVRVPPDERRARAKYGDSAFRRWSLIRARRRWRRAKRGSARLAEKTTSSISQSARTLRPASS